MAVRPTLILLLCTLAAWASSAHAASVEVQATVTRGDLSTTFPPSVMTLPTANLDNGGDQVVYLDLPFIVEDMRGNGAGWSLHVASNGFWQDLAPMPGTSASFVQATTSCRGHGRCTLPAAANPYPVALPDTAAPVRFFRAQPGSGMGTTDVSARMAVTVPGNSLVGAFTTTLTLTQAAGP